MTTLQTFPEAVEPRAATRKARYISEVAVRLALSEALAGLRSLDQASGVIAGRHPELASYFSAAAAGLVGLTQVALRGQTQASGKVG